MIDTHRLVAQMLINTLEAVAQHGGGQVPNVEALGNIDGGVVQTDGFARTHVAGAVLFPADQHVFQRALGEIHPVQEEIQIAVHRLHTSSLRRVKGSGDRLGDLRRRHAQHLGKAEAGEGIIAQIGIRRHSQLTADVCSLGQSLRLGPSLVQRIRQQLRDAGLHIHMEIHSLYHNSQR